VQKERKERRIEQTFSAAENRQLFKCHVKKQHHESMEKKNRVEDFRF